MSEIPLVINVIYLVIGLLQLFVAPRVRPNPYFGFKIGYTFSSREVWRKTNRFAGILITIHALILLSLTPLWENNLGYYVVSLILPLVAIAVVGTIYASHRLGEERIEIHGPVKPVKPLEATFIWKYLGVILFLALIVIMLLAYPVLPDNIAVHFDASGNPDGWPNKGDFYLTYSLFALGYLAMIYFLIYLGKRYPVLLHSRGMKIGRDTVFKSAILALDMVFLIFMGGFMWIYFYNLGEIGGGTMTVTYLIPFSFLGAVAPIVLYNLQMEKREKGGEKR